MLTKWKNITKRGEIGERRKEKWKSMGEEKIE